MEVRIIQLQFIYSGKASKYFQKIPYFRFDRQKFTPNFVLFLFKNAQRGSHLVEKI